MVNFFLYFDPGLGAMLVQVIVAAVAGIFMFSKNAMFKIKALLGINKPQEDVFGSIEIEDEKAKDNDSD